MNPSTKQDKPEWEVVNEAETGQAQREPPVIEGPSGPTEHHAGPIHPLAATLMIVVDSLWNIPDVVGLWPVTIPLSFLTVFVPSLLIQRHLHGNAWGKALAYAMFLGVLAAVPTSILSTPAGVAALAWSGLSWLKKGGSKLVP